MSTSSVEPQVNGIATRSRTAVGMPCGSIRCSSRGSVSTRPPPDLAEHRAVQGPHTDVVQQPARMRTAPDHGCLDLALLRVEEVATGGGVGRERAEAGLVGQLRLADADRLETRPTPLGLLLITIGHS